MSIAKEKKYAAQERYDANNVRHYHLKLNKVTDIDIISKLDTVQSKNGYIKECIRKSLKEEK